MLNCGAMRSLFLLVLFCFGSLQAMTRAQQPAVVQLEISSVGVRTLRFEDETRSRPVLVELWYPTAQNDPIAELEPSELLWVHPKEVRNASLAAVEKKKYPLVLISHGHRGDRRNFSWLASVLVKRGFIVAAIEHHGNSWHSYDPHVSLRFWERARDISFAITQLLKDPNFGKSVDPNRIGFVGFSLGGMTGLSLAGAKAENVKQIAMQQQARFKEIETEVVEKIDFTEAQQSFQEPRIRAMVLFSPATFVFPSATFKKISIPVALFASTGDEMLPFKEHASRLLEHLKPTKQKVYGDQVRHDVFVNLKSEAGWQARPQGTKHTDQVAIHQEVGETTASFFQQALK